MSVASAYDALAESYDAHYLRPIDLAENSVVFEWLGEYPTNSVIDYGCGTGLLLEHLHVIDYMGFDISPGMVDVARRKFPEHEFKVADMETFKPTRQFETCVSLFGSFSYSLNPGAVIKNMYESLLPGGHVFVMALSPKYHTRDHHITGGKLPILAYDLKTLSSVFSSKFKHVDAFGLNSNGEVMGRSIKSVDYLSKYLKFESALGLRSSDYYFSIYVGRKIG